MSSEITPINKKLAIISGNGDLPLSILESAVSNGWNGIVIDIADNQKLKSQSNWKIYDFKVSEAQFISSFENPFLFMPIIFTPFI